MVSPINGSRMNPPVDPVGDRTIERARRDFMDAVRADDRRIRQLNETIRDEVDRSAADRSATDPLRRNRADGQGMHSRGAQPGPARTVHLETARAPDSRMPARGAGPQAGSAGPDRGGVAAPPGQSQDSARRDAVMATLHRTQTLQPPGPGLVPSRGADDPRSAGPAGAAGSRPANPAAATPRAEALSGGVAPRIRPDPIGPPPPPGYRPPPPVAPEGSVLVGPLPERAALNLVAPTEPGGVSGMPGLRLSSATPREVAERIAGFMETGQLDRSPLRFDPVPAILGDQPDHDDEEDDEGRRARSLAQGGGIDHGMPAHDGEIAPLQA